MKKSHLLAAAAIGLLSVAGPAAAHVTVQPNEATAESFSAFVVRVPNEQDEAATIKVQVQFPPLAAVSFQDVPGWERQVKTGKFDEPIEAFGEEQAEGVDTVTWSGGQIEPGEFAEFPFSALTPPGEVDLEFPALQTYEGGEVVRWTGPEDSGTPAALVHTIDLGESAAEGAGQLGVLRDLVNEVESLSTQVEELSANSDESSTPPDAGGEAVDEGEDNEDSGTAVLLGGIGIGLGALALLVALFRGRRSG